MHGLLILNSKLTIIHWILLELSLVLLFGCAHPGHCLSWVCSSDQSQFQGD